MPEKIVVGTRGSKLALAQTEKVVKLLKERYEVEVKIIRSLGDVMKDKPLHEFRGAGAFVQTIDVALAEGKIDVAVHSYKDVPSKIKGTIAAVMERESPCDCLISKNGEGLEELERGAVVGTSSLRRIAQLRRVRPDLKTENLRGNVDTRLRKLREGEYDAIILAEAGLIRLGIDVRRHRLDPEVFVPSANQGIIAVETRKGEEDLVEFVNHERTFLEASVERVVLETLGIGCAVPAGIFASLNSDASNRVRLIVHVYSKSGRDLRVDELISRSSAVEEAREIALNLKEDCKRIMKEYGRF